MVKWIHRIGNIVFMHDGYKTIIISGEMNKEVFCHEYYLIGANAFIAVCEQLHRELC